MTRKLEPEIKDDVILGEFLSALDASFNKSIGKILNILDLAQVSKEAKGVIKSELWDTFDSLKKKVDNKCREIISGCEEIDKGR